MAKKIKTAAQIAREENVAKQLAWDDAAKMFGAETVRRTVYGDTLEVDIDLPSEMDYAIVENAERTMTQAHNAAARIESVIRTWTMEVTNSRKALATFAADLTNEAVNPVEVMKWADRRFEDAAKVRVYTELLPTLRTQGIKAVVNEATKSALRGARNRPSSTSSASNLSEACVTEVLAKVAEDLAFDVACEDRGIFGF